MNLNPSNGAFLFRDRLTRDRTRANTGSSEILGMSGRKSASEGAMSGSGVYPAGGVPQKYGELHTRGLHRRTICRLGDRHATSTPNNQRLACLSNELRCCPKPVSQCPPFPTTRTNAQAGKGGHTPPTLGQDRLCITVVTSIFHKLPPHHASRSLSAAPASIIYYLDNGELRALFQSSRHWESV